MSKKIRVAILDDHPSIVDGYRFRLEKSPDIEIVATMSYGEDVEPTLAEHPVDVLLMDVNVPTSSRNINPYPILHLVPKLLQCYPDMNILAISMLAERGLIRAVVEAGVSGYLLKDDHVNIENLVGVVRQVAGGGIQFSEKAELLLRGRSALEALSPRQLEALSLCLACPEASLGEIAHRMAVADSTIRNLLANAYLKLDVHTRPAAVAKARDLGLITSEPPRATY